MTDDRRLKSTITVYARFRSHHHSTHRDAAAAMLCEPIELSLRCKQCVHVRTRPIAMGLVPRTIHAASCGLPSSP
jgi:hypothetical protein